MTINDLYRKVADMLVSGEYMRKSRRNARYCATCGGELVRQQQREQQPARFQWDDWVSAALVVVLLVGVVWFVAAYFWIVLAVVGLMLFGVVTCEKPKKTVTINVTV